MRPLAVLALAGLVGCAPATPAPTAQVVVYVTTDAPVPPAAGEAPDSLGPVPLFDRIRIEVFEPETIVPCSECARDFAVDSRQIDEGRLSFGVVIRPGTGGYRARVRLYRGIAADATGPRAASSLDTTVALPVIDEGQVREVALLLRTEDVGRPQGSLEHPAEVSSGRAPSGVVGTWPGALRVACTQAAQPDEVCVPGGAFWMGDPRLTDLGDWDLQGHVEHLVVVSSFFVDRHEVTVGDFRASGLAVMPKACYATVVGEGQCSILPGTGKDGAVCVYANDCAPGLGCNEEGASRMCRPYCGGTGNKPCTNGKTCVDLSTDTPVSVLGFCAG